MPIPSVDEMVRRWEEGMKSPTTKRRYSEAMKSLRENPMQLAAAAKEQYVAGVQANADHWAKRLHDADFEAMKHTAATTVAERLTSGAVKALPKYRKRANAAHQGYVDAQNLAREAKKRGASMTERVLIAVNAMKRAAGKPEVTA